MSPSALQNPYYTVSMLVSERRFTVLGFLCYMEMTWLTNLPSLLVVIWIMTYQCVTVASLANGYDWAMLTYNICGIQSSLLRNCLMLPNSGTPNSLG